MRENSKPKKKKKGICLWAIAFPAMLAAGLWYYQANYYGKWQFSYKEDPDMTSNPYQGAYVQIYTGYWESIYDVRERYPDCNVIMLAYNLNDEVELETLPEKKAGDLYKSLQAAQEEHFSVIFRAAYEFGEDCQDPDFDILLGHIEQMSEILNQYKDCIAGVQAGMIGPFGEWRKSKYMDEKTYRVQVLEKWLEMLDMFYHLHYI